MRSWSRGTVARRGARLLLLFVALTALTRAAPLAGVRAERAAPADAPVRLVLPSIDVDAEVGAFGLNDDLTMPVPQRADLVAWYSFSAPAGAEGNAVLAGHRDWERQRGVFYGLGKLSEGDDVWLEDADENWYDYQVVWSASLVDDMAPVQEIVGRTERPSVTLITCSGPFDRSAGHYVERRIVRAELVTEASPTEDSR